MFCTWQSAIIANLKQWHGGIAATDWFLSEQNSINNNCLLFTSQKHTLIIRDTILECLGNFDHLKFLNVHLNLRTRACNASIKMQPPQLGFDPAYRQ